MKKILTLLFAVVTVAAFAAPAMQKAKQQPQKSEAKIEKNAKMGNMYMGKSSMKDYASGVDTMYMAPRGSFFSAYVLEGESFSSYNVCLVPGNTEVTWTNISTGIASDTYGWMFFNPALNDEDFSYSTERDLVTTYPNYPGGWVAPFLFANECSDEAYDAGDFYRGTYSLVMGGKVEFDVYGDGTEMTNMYQFWPRADYNIIMSPSGFSAGLSEEANSFWPNLQQHPRYQNPDADFIKIVNFVQFFNYPGHPYTFSRIQLLASANVTAKQEITAKICRVDEDGLDLANPIAVLSYVFPVDDSGENTQAINFEVMKEDPETGLTQEDWLTIDGDIAIVIDNIEKLQYINPVTSAIKDVADDAHPELFSNDLNGYAIWNYYSNDEVIESRLIPCYCGYYWGSSEESYLPLNMLLSINAQFAYIETYEDNATEYVINAPNGEEEVELILKASEPYDAWGVDNIPDWMTIEAEDYFDEENDEYEGYTILTINIDAGEHSGDVVYTLPGTQFTIKVNPPQPYYLVGTFNEWSQETGMLEFVDNEGVLETEAELEAGAEFKVITPNGDGWTWYGGQDDNGVGYFLINDGLMNTPITLVDGANFRLEKAGKYTFQLDPTAMTLTVVPEAAPVVPGDVNGDGEVTAADVTMIYNILLNDDWTGVVNADQNGDGEVTATDVTCVYNVLLGE